LDISHDEDGQSKGVVYGSQWGKDRNVAKWKWTTQDDLM
jgi:hypothetical protein